MVGTSLVPRHYVVAYIEGWYNSTRMHSILGYQSPAQFERDYVAKTTSANQSKYPTRPANKKSGLILQEKLARIPELTNFISNDTLFTDRYIIYR